MPKEWTTPPGTRAAGPIYLDEFQEFVFDNLENRRTGDANGEIPMEADVVAADYHYSADPGDDGVERVSIWHKPQIAPATAEPCDADEEEWQEMCSVVLERQGEWDLDGLGTVVATFGYTGQKFNLKIGKAAVILPNSTALEGSPKYYADSNDCVLPITAKATYTSEADDEEITLYVGHPGSALGGESAAFTGKLFAHWLGPVSA